MCVLGYLSRSLPQAAVRAPKTEVELAVRPVLDALRGRVEVAGPDTSYKSVADYDPVLVGHCRL